MIVGVFVPSDDIRHQRALMSFANGLKHAGIGVKIVPLESADAKGAPEYDAAVVFGRYKPAIPRSYKRGAIFDKYRHAKRDVVVIDSGYVRRDEYYMIGLNGLNNRADFHSKGSPPDRWNKLGVELQPWRASYPGRSILVCGQVPWDASIYWINYRHWMVQTCENLVARKEGKVRFRPHPLAPDHMPLGCNGLVELCDTSRPLAEDIAGAKIVVTLNSNAAVDAVIQGVPAIACDAGSMAWPVAGRGIDSAVGDEAFKPVRENWAYDLAHCQWNLEEMAKGDPARHLLMDERYARA